MIRWRMAESDEDAKVIGRLVLIDMYREVGRAPLNPDKAFMAIYDCAKAGRAAMIFDGEELIGSLGLVVTDFWYSDQPELVEQWAYILPDYRDGEAGRALFSAARLMAHRMGFPRVTLIVFNKKRSKAKSKLAVIGEQFDFRPAGSAVILEAAQ